MNLSILIDGLKEISFLMKEEPEVSKQLDKKGNPGMVPCGNEFYHFHELTEEIIEIYEKKNVFFHEIVNLKKKLVDLYK